MWLPSEQRRGNARRGLFPGSSRAGGRTRWLSPFGTLALLFHARLPRSPLGFIAALPGRLLPRPVKQRRQGADALRPHARRTRPLTAGVERKVLPDAGWADASSLAVTAESTPAILVEVIEFLASAVLTAPLAQAAGVSPVLGYILSGVALGPKCLGVFANDESISRLAFIGILFLLFEAGLELSSDRLRKLTRYAFGLGTLQVLITAALLGGALSFGGAAFLDSLAPSLKFAAGVSRFDQVAVVAASFALSAKAFVLQILQDKKLASTKLGQAALGVLLLQDIALVPVLVVLPLIEDSSGQGMDAASLASYAATAIGGLAAIGFFGGALLNKVFDLVASSGKREVFVGLAVLCVLGVSQITASLGLSPTLGALVAGVLLAESNYRQQVEADIAPFKGLLLGLFFFTLGAKVDPGLLVQEWQFFAVMLAGLVAFKAAVISALSPFFGLQRKQSVQLGFLLATGSGEACVVFGLADKYKVFDEQVLRVLTTLVVVSAALTYLFAEAGEQVAARLDDDDKVEMPGDRTTVLDDDRGSEVLSPNIVLICGMGPLGQQVASVMSNLIEEGVQWIGVDLDPQRVKELREKDLPVYYGDGSRMQVLSTPRAIIVAYSDAAEVANAMKNLRTSFPGVPILSHASDAAQYSKLLDITAEGRGGSASVPLVSGVTETALCLGSKAIATVARIPSDVEGQLMQYVRQETERRLAESRAGAASTEVDTFFVGPSPDLSLDVWDFEELRPETSERIATSMRFLEAISMLQDKVIENSALARLASEFQSASRGSAASVVAPDLPRRSFAPGEFVYRQGEDGNEMFVVEAGSLAGSLVEEPGTVVAEYAAGDYFGEYAVILRQPRAISVAATTQSQVVVIDRATFAKLT